MALEGDRAAAIGRMNAVSAYLNTLADDSALCLCIYSWYGHYLDGTEGIQVYYYDSSRQVDGVTIIVICDRDIVAIEYIYDKQHKDLDAFASLVLPIEFVLAKELVQRAQPSGVIRLEADERVPIPSGENVEVAVSVKDAVIDCPNVVQSRFRDLRGLLDKIDGSGTE